MLPRLDEKVVEHLFPAIPKRPPVDILNFEPMARASLEYIKEYVLEEYKDGKSISIDFIRGNHLISGPFAELRLKFKVPVKLISPTRGGHYKMGKIGYGRYPKSNDTDLIFIGLKMFFPEISSILDQIKGLHAFLEGEVRTSLDNKYVEFMLTILHQDTDGLDLKLDSKLFASLIERYPDFFIPMIGGPDYIFPPNPRCPLMLTLL
jgi:hypothetical protein